MSNRDRSLLFGQFTIFCYLFSSGLEEFQEGFLIFFFCLSITNFSYLFPSGLEETLTEMAAFLASSLCDEKIVNPDVCDTIIQGIYVFYIIVISIELAFIKSPCFGFHWFLEFVKVSIRIVFTRNFSRDSILS